MSSPEPVIADEGGSNDVEEEKLPSGTSPTADASKEDITAETVPQEDATQENSKAQSETAVGSDMEGDKDKEETSEKPSESSSKPASPSHDSTATSTAPTNDPPEKPSPTNQTGPEGDAQVAVNAILWEAGLSKKEVSKRTKLVDGEVVELDLERCEQLTKLPPQIGKLSMLKTLNLSGCKELKTLPSEISNLQNLTELYLTNCNKLEALPAEVGTLSSLSELYCTNCWELKSLPPEIGNLSSLHHLYLTGCKELKELPVEIGQLSELTELKLFSCILLKTLPSSIGLLQKLTKLDLRLCDGLEKLPPEIGQLGKLTALNLTGCTSLTELPTEVGNLKKLTELILKDCKELKALPTSIVQLSQLTELNCDGCTELKKLAPELKEFESQLGNHGKASGKGKARAVVDKSQSGLDIMRMAAAHLEKVPEAPRGSGSTPSKSSAARDASLFRSPEMVLALDDKFFEDVPSPPPPDQVIDSINENDVLCGRGGETNHHPGNVKYRGLVKQHQLLYLEAKRLDKPRIALKIVNLVRKSGGRFLKKESVIGTWRDVGNTKAREKTSQTLREGAPELRDPMPPPPQASPAFYGNGVMMPDSMLEVQKRKAEELSGQMLQARKKFKLPTNAPAGGPPPPMFPPGDPARMIPPPAVAENFPDDFDLNDPLLRGARIQMLKNRQAGTEPPLTPASKPGDQPITAPSGLDVVYGKGKAIQDHIGNIRFRKIVDMHRQAYHSAFRRADKTQISKDIVQWIRSMGGRFLQLDFASGNYHDVGDECARDKVSHALRSRKEVQRPAKEVNPGSPANNFIPPEERERVMAYTMGIVRNLQTKEQQDAAARSYYQQLHAARVGGAMPPTAGNQDPAMMMMPAAPAAGAGAGQNVGASPAAATTSGEGAAAAPAPPAEPPETLADGTLRKDWPLRDVAEPHENDVLYGRGGKSNHWPGNKRYRQAVRSREWDYLRRKNKDKQLVAMEVVREWRNQTPPGRFLKKDESTGLWQDVGDIKAREKTSQQFRENAPHRPPPMFRAGMPGTGPLPPNMNMPPGADMMMWRNMAAGPFPPPPPPPPLPPAVPQNGTTTPTTTGTSERIASPASSAPENIEV